MRDHVRAFVAIAARTLQLRGPVYEFGSYQVAGQGEIADLRDHFPGQTYIGCDMRPGPGVDRVENLASLDLDSGCAQTVICVDTLEHVFEIRRAVDEMFRVLAPGGVMLITAPMNFHIHAHPDDYWRLTPSCLSRLLEPATARAIGWQGPEKSPHTVLGIACQGPVSSALASRLERFVSEYQAWLAAAAQSEPWNVRLRERLLAPLRSKGERRRRAERYSVRFVLDMPVRVPAASVGMARAALWRS